MKLFTVVTINDKPLNNLSSVFVNETRFHVLHVLTYKHLLNFSYNFNYLFNNIEEKRYFHFAL